MEIEVGEEWKDIKGYEGFYKISSLGKIMNKTYKIKTNNLRKDGYMYLDLYKHGKRKRMLIHRLVAEAFVKNPNNYEQVHHIDGNKQNNNAENLEWFKMYR